MNRSFAEFSSPASPSLREVLRWGESVLRSNFSLEARLEVEVLLAGILNLTRTDLFLQSGRILTKCEREAFQGALIRRKRYEPSAYILGKKNFLGRDFNVNSRVLIPRPETEILVEKAQALLCARGKKMARVLEIGTGSGCIAVSLALEEEGVEIHATDLNESILSVAAENARNWGVLERIRLHKSHIYKELGSELRNYFDMIISNPPYVSASEIHQLQPDLGFEPPLALVAGEDGLGMIKPLLQEGPKFLVPEGILIFEIGHNMSGVVMDLLEQNSYRQIKRWKDDAGHDRIVQGVSPGSI